MPIKIEKYDSRKYLGIKRILGEKRFTYSNTERQIEEIAICYGINKDEFKLTITDLTEHKACPKCHQSREVYHNRFLSLKFDTIEAAEIRYKDMLKLARLLKQSGGKPKK